MAEQKEMCYDTNNHYLVYIKWCTSVIYNGTIFTVNVIIFYE